MFGRRLINSNNAGGSDNSVAKWIVAGNGSMKYTTDYTLSISSTWVDCTHPFVGEIIRAIFYNGICWVACSADGGYNTTRIATSTDGVTFTQRVYNASISVQNKIVWNGTYWTVKTTNGFYYTTDASGETGWTQFSSLNIGGSASYPWSWDGERWLTGQNSTDLYYRQDANPVGAYTLWNDNPSNVTAYFEYNPNGWWVANTRGRTTSNVGMNVWRFDSVAGPIIAISNNSTFGSVSGGINTPEGALVQQFNNQAAPIRYARLDSSGSLIGVESNVTYGINNLGSGDIYAKSHNGYNLAFCTAGSGNLPYRSDTDVTSLTGWSVIQPLGGSSINTVGSSINTLCIPQINV